jgi:RNA polymerase sigma factor (TIGR02999 family)
MAVRLQVAAVFCAFTDRQCQPMNAGLLWLDRGVAAMAPFKPARVRPVLTMNRVGGQDDNGVTGLLQAWSDGDREAFDGVLPHVYDELHRMAARYLAGERSNNSLQATALVNELCVRLLGWDPVRWQNRQHFFGVSAQMMRRVLVDIARRRRAARRGGPGTIRVPLDSVEIAALAPGADVLAVDEALQQLAEQDPRKAQVVELRFFGGLSVEETAEALGVSVRTVHTDWAFARAWLYRALTAAHAV